MGIAGTKLTERTVLPNLGERKYGIKRRDLKGKGSDVFDKGRILW